MPKNTLIVGIRHGIEAIQQQIICKIESACEGDACESCGSGDEANTRSPIVRPCFPASAARLAVTHSLE
jgi:hypothetical protein